MIKKITPGDFSVRPLFSNKSLVRLIIPLIIEQLLTITVGMADSIMIAGVGEAAVSAVSLVDTVNVLLINIFAAFATGGAVIIGQYLGRGDNEKASGAAAQLTVFTTLFSVVVMAAMYFGKNFILHTLFGKIDGDVMANSELYLLIVSASIPFIAIYNCGAASFRAMGNSRVSMLTSLVMNVINITGNAVLIFGFKWGIAGAAVPTLISRIAAAVIIIVLLQNKSLTVHIPKRIFVRPDMHLIKKILRLGVPNGLENSMFQLGKILLLSLVSGFGTVSIAANAVANTVAQFQILPGMAMGFALLTVVSRCVGAGDYKQAEYYTKKLMLVVYVAMIILNIAVDALLPAIMGIYDLSAETSALTTQILLYHSACCVLIWPLSFTLPNTMRAANDVRFCMIVAVASMWIWRIVFAYVLCGYFSLGVMGVWIAMTIDWLFRTVCFVFRYKRGKWKLIKI